MCFCWLFYKIKKILIRHFSVGPDKNTGWYLNSRTFQARSTNSSQRKAVTGKNWRKFMKSKTLSIQCNTWIYNTVALLITAVIYVMAFILYFTLHYFTLHFHVSYTGIHYWYGNDLILIYLYTKYTKVESSMNLSVW